MPSHIDPQTIYVDPLPTIWSPVQWELTEDERLQELHQQATASLLWTADMPEAVLRLLLGETEIKRTTQPPEGYDETIQDEWDDSLVTFAFRRRVKLLNIEREEDYLYVEYDMEGLGRYALEIEADSVSMYRI